MIDAEILRAIQLEVQKQVNVILHARTGTNTVEGEDIEEMYAGMPTQEKRPVMHPYGFASRAPRGILSIIGRIGAHFGNRFIMGHRDPGRPLGLQEGETAVYNKFGHQIQMQENQVVIAHNTGAAVIIDGDGTVTLLAKDGTMFSLNAKTGEIIIANKDGHLISATKEGVNIGTADGKNFVTLKEEDGKVQICADKAIALSCQNVTLDGGNINIGSNAAFGGVLAEFLEAYLDSHTHTCATPGSPGSPPIVPSSVWNLSPVQSFKSLYVKMRSNIV